MDSWKCVLEEDTCVQMFDVIVGLLGDEARLVQRHFSMDLAQLRCVLLGRVTVAGLAKHTEPHSADWAREGVLLFEYPPMGGSSAIWHGWMEQVLLHLSRRKAYQRIVFGLFGRPTWRLKRSITQPCDCFPATDARDYKECALAALSKLLAPGARKIIW